MLTSDLSHLTWLLCGFAAAGVVFLVLVLQSFTYSTSWKGSSAEVPKATFRGTFLL